MSILKKGQEWPDEEGTVDVILSIDEGTDYPVQYRMVGSHSIGRDTIEGFLASHHQPTEFWLKLIANHEGLADYIISWLQTRNRGELQESFDNMRMRDAQNLKSELVWILESGGKPKNWI